MNLLLMLLIGLAVAGQSLESKEQSEGGINAPEPLALVESDEDTRSEVELLIALLASSDFRHRVDATERLRVIGPAAFSQLRDSYVQSDDMELRLRIERIVETAYHEYHVYMRKAFLGISLSAFDITLVPDVPLPPETQAVFITNVIEGTAAFQAGLERNDVIVALNGEELNPTDDDEPAAEAPRQSALVNHFSRRIANFRPGDEITVQVQRGQEAMIFAVTLGFLPEHMRARSNVSAINAAMIKSRQKFDAWWNAHFAAMDTDR